MPIADQADEFAQEDMAMAKLRHTFAFPGVECDFDIFGGLRIAVDHHDLAALARERHCRA
jgi:hypothetical protein